MPTSRFVRAYPPAAPPPSEGAAVWLPFRGGELLIKPGRGEGTAASLARGPATRLPTLPRFGDEEPVYLGALDGVPCFAYEVAEATEATDSADQVDVAENGSSAGGWQSVGLRALYGLVDEAEYGLAGYASQMLHWRRVSRFCSACGQPTEGVENTWGRKCVACGHVAYPPVSPAVLILVHDGGDRVLLASKEGWGKRYSILAGFVEPGEALEECVAREALEEAGVPLTDLVYAGSQPWPYPHQIMIGFNARYAGGHFPTQADLRLDKTELARADWFRFDALPELPPPLSLSRQMIEAWATAAAHRAVR